MSSPYITMHPTDIYLFKSNKRNTRKRCEICSKLTIIIPERRQSRHSSVFTVNIEHILQLFLVFLFLNLNNYSTLSWVRGC